MQKSDNLDYTDTGEQITCKKSIKEKYAWQNFVCNE